MAVAVLMPKQGNTVEECILVGWKKKKGEAVKTGDIIASIETDKATFDIEATADGEILETYFPEGALVPVLVNIAVIGNKGEDTAAFKPQAPTKSDAAPATAPSGAPAGAGAAPTAAAPQSAAKASAPQAMAASQAGVSPRARRIAERLGVNPATLAGSGAHGRVQGKDVIAAADGKPRVSALARELAAEGKRLPTSGTGVAGMIRASDLLEPGIPLSNMRKVVAARMAESLSETAQFTASASADATGMMKLRAFVKKNAASIGLPDITFGDMVMFATVKALIEHPEINAEFIDGQVFRHKSIHLGFACDTPRGLMVPVVKNAQDLTIGALASRIKELAKLAIDGKISPDDLSGGTFTVSNLGSFGVEAFTPIINYPQVAILGVCTISLKPVRRDGQVAFIEHLGYSLTSDHQIVDGAPAARFMQTVIKKTEDIIALSGIAVA
jgi:pyruvate dehydrogenase E2 component (dihydrolipoamide acetyltransferase)